MLIIDCFDNSDLGEEESLKTKLQQKENLTEECLVLLAFFFFNFFFLFSLPPSRKSIENVLFLRMGNGFARKESVKSL